MSVTSLFGQNLRLPVIAAPMFLVSGLELVQACCQAGIVGSFPAANARTLEDLRDWLTQMQAFQTAHPEAAPYAMNVILLDKMNDRKAEELALAEEFKVPVLITSVGDPTEVVQRAHAWGGKVIHDVVSIRHAQKAAQAKVDGLILVCGGAGGHTGQLNPFAFVPQIREFWDGLLIVGGSISHGETVRAVEILGADMAYIGSRFIATHESMASHEYKQILLDSQASDVVLSPVFSGVPAHYLKPSIARAGLDPEQYTVEDVKIKNIKAWRDVWSAGHGVGSIQDIIPVAQLVDRLLQEYQSAIQQPAFGTA
ncbi:MAG: nitronate monooxygenase [Pseudomonadota bacterium]|nr:nitronate monooxygenase [Pseudomonadota bacterium]